MSVSAQETIFHYVGNGITVTFAFNCQVLRDADLGVYLNDVLTSSGFTISGIGELTGGSVTFDIPPANLVAVRLEREVTLERTTDYQQNGDFLARVVNPDFNRLWMALQQHATMFRRALMAPKSDATGPAAMPSVADRAGKLLSFDGDGNPVAVAAALGTATGLQLFLTGPYGASVLGHLDPATDAVATLMSEIASRTISVFDFMSTAERADFLSGDPVLDHAPAVNRAIAAANGKGRVMAHRKRTGAWLFKTPISLGASNLVDSNVVLDFEPGSRQQFDPADIADTMFSVKNFPGHFNLQGVNNLHAYSLSADGNAFKFNGQCYGSFNDNYLETFNAGIIFSNAGNKVFNEFVRFNNLELHLCTTGILMDKDGGTDTSMHGVAFRNTTINVGPGQVGLQMIGTAWYNADSDLKFFSAADSEAIIKMSTGAITQFEGAFISGSITCEGPAKITGIGRFILNGQATFLSGVTDTLVAPDAWEQGFTARNYLKPVPFGSSGLTVSEVRGKAEPLGTDGPFGSFARLTDTGVESLVANSCAAHAAIPGNGFYTGHTGYHQNYSAGVLGHFLSSDGTEQRSFAPTSVQCVFKHNEQYIFRFDGINRANNTEGFLIGSGGAGVYSGNISPEGALSASVGSTFQRRDGGAVTTLYVKESGSGNTGWVAK